MSRLATALALLLVMVAPLQGQATSTIGAYLAPWGGMNDVSGLITMSPDGQTILLLENALGNCSSLFLQQRLSTIRPDGTGHRVVVDENTLTALWPNGQTFIDRLTMSGDGTRAAFAWSPLWVNCTQMALLQSYLVDLTSGVVTPFSFNGQPVGPISFSDDGTKMAFKGFDPAAGSWSFYLANPDGTGAVEFLDASAFCSCFGVLSGDGTKFLFVGIDNCVCPCASNVFLHDIASGTTLQLTPEPSSTLGIALSYDGSRIVYEANASVWAVNADGTGLHVIAESAGGGTATITRDGEYVFYRGYHGNWAGYRSRFDGTDQLFVGGFNVAGIALIHQPVNADGSLYAFYDKAYGPPGPLGVWFEDLPMLTTYGFGNPGTPLTWDVGGEPGDRYILASAFDVLNPGKVTQYGLLQLDPASLVVLAEGSITGPNNTGSVQLIVPPSASLPLPLTLHFQALVQPQSGGGALTNRTTVMLQDAPGDSAGLALGAPAQPPEWSVARPSTSANAPWTSPPTPGAPQITPEDFMRRLALLDPQFGATWFAEQ